MRRRGHTTIAALTCCAALVALTDSASATFSGSNGKIAYTGFAAGGSSEIVTVKPDGTGTTNLTNNPNQDVGPAWSPDGKQIAFTSDRESPLHGTAVYVMDADGGNVTRLASGGYAPTWSPDGSKIAFVSGNRILVTNADGSGSSTDVINGFDPSWSPDGSKLAFVRSSDIWTSNADGTGEAQLTTGSAFDGYPDWSPDGTKLTYSSDAGGLYQIYTMNPDGSGSAALTVPSFQAFSPKWSPDQSRILYSPQNGDALRTIKPDGTGDAELAPDAFSYDSDWQPVKPGKVPPSASFSVSASSPQTNEVITLTASSTGGSGSVVQQRWDLDGDGDFDDATGPNATTSFADAGTHIIRLSVTNSLGYTDAVARAVEAVAPPETNISAAPSGTISYSNPTFSFNSPQAGSSFQCRLDAGAWAPCSSPFQVSPLGDGRHAFAVRAVDSAGRADPTPSEATFVVDTPPETQITSGPKAQGPSSDARFTFTADQPATFECRRDGSAWVPCASPWSYSKLEEGSHSFEVRATDSTGNIDATPAVSFWDVGGCNAPSLKGKSFSAAKRLIKKSGCTLGKVKKPKGVPAGKLVVAKQKTRGDAVDLRLVRR